MGRMISRMQFLRAERPGPGTPLRPPWALPERAFVEVCERCTACIEACPEHLLGRGRGGFPELSFAAGPCTFCGECARACTAGALRALGPASGGPAPPWDLAAAIEPHCLSRRGVVCRVCGEHCPGEAIRFRLERGGVGIPELRRERCTGCGACYAPCPVRAVSVLAQPRGVELTHRRSEP